MKLNVVMIIRDRDKELKLCTDALQKIFKDQNIDAMYTIAEQEQGAAFNRAKLLNVGFINAESNNFSSNYLLTDIDLWPNDSSTVDYRNIRHNVIRHPYGQDRGLGGFILMKSEVFKKLNGFSNKYWGWGGEDKDLQYRAKLLNIKIDRSNFIKRYSTQTLIHDDISFTAKKHPSKYKKTENIYQNMVALYDASIDNINLDGLSNVVYTIISKTKYKNKPNMNRILISI
jgi:hypothetical protein